MIGTNRNLSVKAGLTSKGKALSKWMVTSALVAAGAMSFVSPSYAVDIELPTGGVVVGGSATFSNPTASKLDINQTSQRTVINWDKFNIGSAATVQFYQPNTSAVAVNRVSNDGQFSRIDGHLIANGKVVILDPNGVIFGSGSTIDVGSIVASTGDINVTDFMAGSPNLQLSNFGTGSVINNGTINAADSGLVALVGTVAQNNGIINANLGRVSLAAGNETATVDLFGDGLVELAYTNKDDSLLAENNGTINAVGGKIRLTAAAAKDVVDSVVNMNGIARATSASVVNGKIILSAKKVSVGAGATTKGQTTITAKTTDLKSTIDGTVNGSSAVVNVSSGAKIAQALDVIDTNGTINVGAGTYNEHLVVSKQGVTLNGAKAGISATSGRGAGESIIVPNSPGLTINASDVTVDGFMISGATGADGYGIFVNAANNTTLLNNFIKNVSQYGVYGLRSNNLKMVRNQIQRTGNHGVYLLSSNNAQLLHNQVGVLKAGSHNINGDGVRLDNSSSAYLFNNNIAQTTSTGSDIGSGIYVSNNSNNVSLIRNSLYTLDWDGIKIGKSTGTRVIDNDIHHAKRVGVYAKQSGGLTIDKNYINDTDIRSIMVELMTGGSTITNNTINYSGVDGIYAYRANNTNILNNQIGYGFDRTLGTADDDLVSRNGVRVENSDAVKINGNSVAGSVGVGVYVMSTTNLQLGDVGAGNIVNKAGAGGIYVAFSQGAKIQHNSVGLLGGADNIVGDGILVKGSNNSEVSNNSVSNTRSTAADVGSSIHVKDSDSVLISNNVLSNSEWDGIKVTGGASVTASGNVINNVDRAGFYAKNGSFLTVDGNTVRGTGRTGLIVQDMTGPSSIINNSVDASERDGISVLNSDNTDVLNNWVGYGADKVLGTEDDSVIALDGVHIINSDSLNVNGNHIAHAGSNGIYAFNIGGLVNINSNVIDDSEQSGIFVDGYNGSTVVTLPDVEFFWISPLAVVGPADSLNLIGNKITDSIKEDGITLYDTSGSVNIQNNIITESGYSGVFIDSALPANYNITGNTIENLAPAIDIPYTGRSAIHANAGAGNTVYIAGNTLGGSFLNGVAVYSGTIDLTGNSNLIHDTMIGLGFYPMALPDVTDVDYFNTLANQIQLVGNTIGTTQFVDQSEFFVELDRGAFFLNGAPIVLNGNDASYTLAGTTIAPSLAGGVTAAEYTLLDSMLYDFNEADFRGIFNFDILPEPPPINPPANEGILGFSIDQKDVFHGLGFPETPDEGGSLTITGLPGQGGGTGGGNLPSNPAAIEPAAGDEGVSGIEPAAGTENVNKTACWADANQSLGQGTPVTFSFGEEASSLLQDAANCGNANSQQGSAI